MNELSRFIWGIRICTTVIIAIIGIVVLAVWGMLLTDDMSTYKAGHPNKQVIKALEQELGVKLPAEVKIASISTTTIFFDDDETIKIDVVSNYTEEQWRELIAAIPVLPYEKVYYRIKLGYWS